MGIAAQERREDRPRSHPGHHPARPAHRHQPASRCGRFLHSPLREGAPHAPGKGSSSSSRPPRTLVARNEAPSLTPGLRRCRGQPPCTVTPGASRGMPHGLRQVPERRAQRRWAPPRLPRLDQHPEQGRPSTTTRSTRARLPGSRNRPKRSSLALPATSKSSTPTASGATSWSRTRRPGGSSTRTPTRSWSSRSVLDDHQRRHPPDWPRTQESRLDRSQDGFFERWPGPGSNRRPSAFQADARTN